MLEGDKVTKDIHSGSIDETRRRMARRYAPVFAGLGIGVPVHYVIVGAGCARDYVTLRSVCRELGVRYLC